LVFKAFVGELTQFGLTFLMPEKTRPLSLAFCFICLII